MRLDGSKVFITGGSSGIGLAAARELARQGAGVWIGARDQAKLDAALQEIRKAARSADQSFGAVSMDVRDLALVRSATDRMIEGLGGLDILIACSGYARAGHLKDLPEEIFDDMMATNYRGHVNTVRALLPHFMAQKSGHICLVSSMLGYLGSYGYTAYAASKHAVAGFGRCLRQDLLPHGVEVSLFYPPTTDTPGLAEENKTKPPECWAVESASKKYTAEAVAHDLLRTIAQGRAEGVAGFEGWYIHLANRLAPGLVRSVMDSELRKALVLSARPGQDSKP
jgi:3-dehydrosphinganine reductase